MPINVDELSIVSVGKVLNDPSKPLSERFRALFTLKNIGGPESICQIQNCFFDKSDLLKHELGYCLGQMRDTSAIPFLQGILNSESESVIVRHEAAEALGAIGCKSSLKLLEEYCKHPIKELQETAVLAVERIKCNERLIESSKSTIYTSVDPAPAFEEEKSVEDLKNCLLDENISLFERYKAMFSLRNMSTDDSILALAEGLKCNSALFRHEISFVLGQIASPVAVPALKHALEDKMEHSMVRHESAEALGAIANEECFEILNKFINDEERVVRESCIVALDMCEHENSNEFQYANGLVNCAK